MIFPTRSFRMIRLARRNVAARVALACVAFALANAAQAHAADASATSALRPDGPYVVRSADGGWEAWSVDVRPEGARKRSRSVRATARITVPAVGRLPAFRVELRKAADVSPEVLTASADTPLFVVADTHGEFEILAELLLRHRVVDRALKWTFGRGNLVFLGDVFDRGPNHTEILWLIYKLEAESKGAGGAVHLILGNHETMVMRGDLRYLNPKYLAAAEALGVSSYAALFGPDSVLGQWLRAKPAVLKINDLLCLHGGISRAVVDRNLALADINTSVRAVLNASLPETGPEQERAQFLMGQLGPLWYRGYFAEEENFPAATDEDIDSIREHFGVRTILVGHTIVPTVTPLYGRKVIAVQVYPRRDEQTGRAILESLLIKQGKFFRAKIDGSIERLD